ncbi:hypothetical protein FHG87_000219 [Trinorchestia longiramus]|nr:hypothetical protein FHG87_000219 [Trinorchestia longiramus]
MGLISLIEPDCCPVESAPTRRLPRGAGMGFEGLSWVACTPPPRKCLAGSYIPAADSTLGFTIADSLICLHCQNLLFQLVIKAHPEASGMLLITVCTPWRASAGQLVLLSSTIGTYTRLSTACLSSVSKILTFEAATRLWYICIAVLSALSTQYKRPVASYMGRNRLGQSASQFPAQVMITFNYVNMAHRCSIRSFNGYSSQACLLWLDLPGPKFRKYSPNLHGSVQALPPRQGKDTGEGTYL